MNDPKDPPLASVTLSVNRKVLKVTLAVIALTLVVIAAGVSGYAVYQDRQDDPWDVCDWAKEGDENYEANGSQWRKCLVVECLIPMPTSCHSYTDQYGESWHEEHKNLLPLP